MTYGSTIRQLRKQAGLTQEALARKIQRCPATISLYERQLRDIPTSVLMKIATIFQVSPGDLFAVDVPPRCRGEEYES